MPTLHLILSDQLSHALPSLKEVKQDGIIFMCEVMTECTYVNHHPKKIAFQFSCMRHFAQELQTEGKNVRYVTLDAPDNTGSLEGEVDRAIKDLMINNIILTEPGEYRLLQIFKQWQKALGIPVTILPDSRFLCSIKEFNLWAENRSQLRMEYFYREMRKKYNILIEPNGKPTGDKWNFDKQNRKTPPKKIVVPQRISHTKDKITKDVLQLTQKYFSNNFGNLQPFYYAVTRSQALLELKHFIQELLPKFGEYQDIMMINQPYLYHSLISSYLNAGLLLPLEICHMAENAYKSGAVPLNAAEGFIRQILGWREYVRGIYWHHMPKYGEMNFFNTQEKLPKFYWTADTKMSCIKEVIEHTRDHAYSHHIQRLMVTGNFAMLAGIDVKQVQKWYLEVYSDAYEWVEMPNTLGMALFGDGGIMGSKPYAASGKYINKMSNYCKNCIYNSEETTTDNACPFNSLYWDFMVRNQPKLKSNQRLPYVYSTWIKFGAEKQNAIRAKAANIIQKMRENKL